jgi:hypothetical protein
MAGVTEISRALHEDGPSRLHPMLIEGWIPPRAKRNVRGLCERLRLPQLLYPPAKSCTTSARPCENCLALP